MQTFSGIPTKIWGSSIVGFGSYKYEGKSTKGEWFYIGFSPRKQNTAIYAISGFKKEKELMARMGKYKTGKSCLYIKPLSDIDMGCSKNF